MCLRCTHNVFGNGSFSVASHCMLNTYHHICGRIRTIDILSNHCLTFAFDYSRIWLLVLVHFSSLLTNLHQGIPEISCVWSHHRNVRIAAVIICAVLSRFILVVVLLLLHCYSKLHSESIFNARCNIYIARLCYDVSIRLSVTEVHCDHGACR